MLEDAVALCKRFEGFRSKPYLCPAGVATIGYGSTFYEGGRQVLMSDAPISEARALALLMHELEHRYLPGVRRLCPVLWSIAVTERNPRKLCAIVDFAYNFGLGRLQTSTLRRKVSSRDWAGAREQLMLWVQGGGRVLRGLQLRAKAREMLMR